MNFTLFYRGKLKSNGKPEEKHALRKHFHPQLRQLWNQPPLSNFSSFYESSLDQMESSITYRVGKFRFTPLVCTGLHLVARLDITLLRPEAPGSLITTGGDIDNRLKTLLDSLKIPKERSALPKGSFPNTDEDPFFCLLEDDNLVTEIAVRTKQLLEPEYQKGEVVVLLEVTTLKTSTLLGGMELP
jgi:Holliday junction resolvase RusA-like endonuclease